MTATDFEPLADLLHRNGLARVVEEPFPNDGWSGASLTLLRRGGDRFVLKRDSLARDWICRATNDGPVLREAWFAARGPLLPPPLRAPYLGVGIAGDEFALLMPDLTTVLFDWEATISVDSLDRVLEGLARLHGHEWPSAASADGRWCGLRERVTLICRTSLERSGPQRDAVAERLLPGWDAFDRFAPRAAREVVASMATDPRPLLDALAALPSTLIHGDLKLANVGIESDGTIDLVDWQMVTVAPVAVELGWFLVANVASLPLPPDQVLERYRRVSADAADWDAQVDCAILVGLLLRGWRKGFDAEAGLTLGSGISATDDLAWWCDRAVDAAARVL